MCACDLLQTGLSSYFQSHCDFLSLEKTTFVAAVMLLATGTFDWLLTDHQAQAPLDEFVLKGGLVKHSVTYKAVGCSTPHYLSVWWKTWSATWIKSLQFGVFTQKVDISGHILASLMQGHTGILQGDASSVKDSFFVSSFPGSLVSNAWLRLVFDT